MASWLTIGYSIGLHSIEAAYRSSSTAFERELVSINAEWDKLIAYRRANPDDDDDDAYHYNDHLSDEAFDAENGIRLIREAFALTLYHFWEKHTVSLLALGKVDHKGLVKAIKSKGWKVFDEPGMDRLHLIANTVKHSNGTKLYKLDPTIFAPEAAQLDPDPESREGWHLFLRLRDEDIKAGIAAVRASGPKNDWRGLPEEEED